MTTQSAESSFAAPPDPELERLKPRLGAWRAEDCSRDSLLGPGVWVTSIEKFHWLDGGYFLVHEYEITFGTEPPQRGVNSSGFDSEAGKFQITFFTNNGPYGGVDRRCELFPD